MKYLEIFVKVSIIILCLSVTYKVLTFQNSGRYVFMEALQTLDTETGIITTKHDSETDLFPFNQINPLKGEKRYFLDRKRILRDPSRTGRANREGKREASMQSA